MSGVNTAPIRRYVVQHDYGRGRRIASTFKTQDEAVAKAREEKANHAHWRITIVPFELRPNPQILKFGIERYDRMLTEVLSEGIKLMGSLDELIACGAIGSYIRDILGKSGCKSSCDEYGNQYRLDRRGKDRYELTLYCTEEARIPDGNALRSIGFTNRDPLETDISGILERIRARQTGGAS